ncbi:MAG: rod shape-determining protein RodA [Spirochaetaceae bacterium]|nr:rod shape-determining protein RodA [Spirochaetaceae bacterium]
MKLRFFSYLDFLLLFSVLFLTTIGVFFIYSSGINSAGVSVSNEYIKQSFFASIGLILMILMILIDYKKLRQLSPHFFIVLILLLIYTRLFGKTANGAKSWIGIGDFGIQPSEFGKIVYILFFAWFLDRYKKMDPKRRFGLSLFILLLPMGLILIQPDLGTASVYVPIFLAMCFVSEIPVRYILFVLALGVLTVVITVLPIWESDIYRKPLPFFAIFSNQSLKITLILIFAFVSVISLIGYIFFKHSYLYWTAYSFLIFTFSFLCSIAFSKVLKPYQISRLIIFLNPNIDPLGSGWNIIQSKIAIGAGGIFGQGFLKGTQSHYRFLPQQSTDFIFSIFSEEMGFLGGCVVFLLFIIIFARALNIGFSSKNTYGYYVAVGIAAMFFYHFIVNVGMVAGIMPITGIPLFFMSYGGSSLWTAMISIGILMSINMRKIEY